MTHDFSVKQFWKYGRELTPTESIWFDYYVRKFRRLALNVYEWEGVPETVDPYLIEKYLYEDGYCIVWNDPTYGLVVSRCKITRWDAWKQPLKVQPVYDGIADVLPEIDISECAFITDLYDWNLKRRDALELISEIVRVQDVIDTQNMNQASPLLAISGNSKMRAKLNRCIEKIAGGFKVMFIEDDITQSLKPLNLNGPYNVNTLLQYKTNLVNEVLSYLGIDSKEAYVKSERSLVDEQEANDELLNYMLADGLKARQRALDGNTIGFKAEVRIQSFIRPEMVDDENGQGDFVKEDENDVDTQ